MDVRNASRFDQLLANCPLRALVMVRVSDAGPEVRLNLFTAKWAEPVRDLLAAGFWTAGLVGRTPEGVIRRESRAVGDSRQETLEAMMDEAEVAFLCRTLGKGVIGKA